MRRIICLYFSSYFAEYHASFYNEAQHFFKKSYFGYYFIKIKNIASNTALKCTITIIIQFYPKTHMVKQSVQHFIPLLSS